MEKLIVKTALLTIAGLAVAAVIVFFSWMLCSPQTMADSCERTGNYSLAVTCADLRYKYTGEVKDLARCAEDSILSEKDKHIVTYCTKLADHEDFDKLCEDKNKAFAHIQYGELTGDYKDYICGHLAVAQYRSGNIKEAVAAAEKGSIQSFIKMIVAIYDKEDKSAAAEVVPALQNMIPAIEEEIAITTDKTQLKSAKEKLDLVKSLIEILEKI